MDRDFEIIPIELSNALPVRMAGIGKEIVIVQQEREPIFIDVKTMERRCPENRK